MKHFHSLPLIGFSFLLLSSCGTASSLTEKETYVHYASVQINDTIQVSGQLINLNDSTIAISLAGAYAEYPLSNIKSYECYTAPNPGLMQRDIVRNTAKSTSHSGFFVAVTAITLVITAMFVTGQVL